MDGSEPHLDDLVVDNEGSTFVAAHTTYQGSDVVRVEKFDLYGGHAHWGWPEYNSVARVFTAVPGVPLSGDIDLTVDDSHRPIISYGITNNQNGLVFSFLARLTEVYGSADPEWSGDGYLTLPPTDGETIVNDADWDPLTKKILISGTSRGGSVERCMVMRFTDTGDPDPSFGSNPSLPGYSSWSKGYQYCEGAGLDVSGSEIRLFARSGNNPIETGSGPVYGYIVAMTDKGVVNSAWGMAGFRLFKDRSWYATNWLSAGQIASDGKTVAGGHYSNSSGTEVARYTTTGSPDTTFSGDGYAVADL